MNTLLAAALLIGAPGLKDKAKPVTLVGIWAPESVNVGGQVSELGSDRWTFTAEGTYTIGKAGKPLDAAKFADDPKAKTLDLNSVRVGTNNLCRYQIEGDTLILAVGHDPNVRPDGLETGPKVTIWVMKRVKE